MTPDDIRTRLEALERMPNAPAFDIYLIRAVISAIDGDMDLADLFLDRASLVGKGRLGWAIPEWVRAAIRGNQTARLDVWVHRLDDMPYHNLLMAALLLLAGPPPDVPSIAFKKGDRVRVALPGLGLVLTGCIGMANQAGTAVAVALASEVMIPPVVTRVLFLRYEAGRWHYLDEAATIEPIET